MWPPRHYSLKVEVAKLPLAWQEESVVRKVEHSPAHKEYTVQHLMFRSAREEGEMTGPDRDHTVAPKSCLG